jgi:glycosyltransferase involved in cell wall biosynthesis
LAKALLDANPSVQIDYWVNGDNLKRTPELRQIGGNFRLIEMDVHKPLPLHHRLVNRLSRLFGKKLYAERNDIDEIEQKIRDYDLAYFPSAHMMKKPNLPIPIVGTIHDFNWKYFFGQQNFNAVFVAEMDRAVVDWIEHAGTACSARDVVHEAQKLYPGLSRYPAVIPIAPVVFESTMTDEEALDILRELDIDFPYILFPGNFFAHKNHLNLISAFAQMKRRFPELSAYRLLFTGAGSEKAGIGIAEERGIRLVRTGEQYDTRGMGYLSNQQVDALIKKAALLVSPSIYEAICTPGMDAWNFGTPTAISDIPPFREHETTWGIQSAFFNPMNPEHMAAVIGSCLLNLDDTRKTGEASKRQLSRYTWEMVANSYMDLFQQTLHSFK